MVGQLFWFALVHGCLSSTTLWNSCGLLVCKLKDARVDLDQCTKVAILRFCFTVLQLLSFGANLCCPATTVAEFFSCTRGNSAPLLPQEQNVSHQAKVLLFWYQIAGCFLPETYSVLLLPQQQNVSHQRNILLLCSHRNILLLWYRNSRIFVQNATV